MDTDIQVQAAIRAQTASAVTPIASPAVYEVKENGGKILPPATETLTAVEVVANERDDKVQKKTDKVEVEDAAKIVSDFLNTSQRGLEFSVNEDAGRTVVKVMDVKEEKVIRQIPSDEVLKLAQKVRELKEELSGKTGMLFESEA